MSNKKDPGSLSRRAFIKTMGVGVAGATVASALPATAADDKNSPPPGTAMLAFTVNGKAHRLHIEPRTTLAEVLRDQLGLTGTKTACERGMCGTCTVLLDDMAVYSCHTLALDAGGDPLPPGPARL